MPITNDRGSLRATSREVLDRAETLRRQLPKRWTSTLLDILVREGSFDATEQPHRATIDRHLRRRRASRRQLAVLGAKPTIAAPGSPRSEGLIGGSSRR